MLLFTLRLSESMCFVHPVFYVSILKPAMFNSFPERTQPAPTPVIINKKPKYEISQIVDFKINCQWAYKLLYKVIWLGYEDTENKSKWIPTFELTYAANLVSVKIIDGELCFYFLFSLYFIFILFSIFRTTRVRVYQSCCHISHKLMAKSQDWSWDLKNRVEDSGTKWRHTVWTTHAGLMLYSWSFRVGCTVVSTDHG